MNKRTNWQMLAALAVNCPSIYFALTEHMPETETLTAVRILAFCHKHNERATETSQDIIPQDIMEWLSE